MKAMATFFRHACRVPRPRAGFGFQECLAPAKLLQKNPRASLPGQCEPGEKRRALVLIRPVLALERIGEGRFAASRRLVDLAFGAARSVFRLNRSDKAALLEFL